MFKQVKCRFLWLYTVGLGLFGFVDLQAQSIATYIGGLHATPTTAGPASVFWNPAGIGVFNNPRLQTNIASQYAWFEYDRDGTNPVTNNPYEASNTNTFVPNPFVSISYPFRNSKWSIGYGTYFPSGAMADFDEQGAQRYHIIEGALISWHHQLSIAYQHNREWSFALAGIYSLGLFQSELDIDLGEEFSSMLANEEIPAEHPALASRLTIPWNHAHGFGLAAGVLYRPNIQSSFGLSVLSPVYYRFQENFELEMPNIIQALGAAPASLGLTANSTHRVSVRHSLPAAIQAGVKYQPFGYWVGENFIRITLEALNSPMTVEVQQSSIETLAGAKAKSAKRGNSILLGTTQTLSLWRSWAFGLNGTYYRTGLASDDLSPTQVDFDSIAMGLFSKYEWTDSLHLGFEYSRSFILRREASSKKGGKDDSMLRFRDAPGEYRASMDRIGVQLSYGF